MSTQVVNSFDWVVMRAAVGHICVLVLQIHSRLSYCSICAPLVFHVNIALFLNQYFGQFH